MFVQRHTCACLCVTQVIRGDCSEGLCGPPTEALFSKQQMEQERQGLQMKRQTAVSLHLLHLFSINLSTSRGTKNVKAKVHLPLSA